MEWSSEEVACDRCPVPRSSQSPYVPGAEGVAIGKKKVRVVRAVRKEEMVAARRDRHSAAWRGVDAILWMGHTQRRHPFDLIWVQRTF